MKINSKFCKIMSLILALMFVFSFAGCTTEKAATDKTATATTAPSAAATLASAAPAATAATLNGEILMGVAVSLTGERALTGERCKFGALLAQKEINATGGILGKKLVLDIEDDAGSADAALIVVSKFISKQAVAIICPLLSTQVLAVNDTLKEAKMIGFANGTSPKLTLSNTGNSYLFYTRPNDTTSAEVAGKYLVETLGCKKVGIFYNNDDMGSGGKSVLTKYFDSVKIPYVLGGHNSGDKDVTGQILAFKNAGCDGIACWGHEPELALFAQQLMTFTYKPYVIGSSSVTQEAFTTLVESQAVEGWFTSCDVSSELDEPTTKRLEKNAQAEYGVSIDMPYVAYYGDVYLLKDAIERAGTTEREALHKALKETKNLDVAYNYTCDSENNLVHKCIICKLVNKKPVTIGTVATDIK